MQALHPRLIAAALVGLGLAAAVSHASAQVTAPTARDEEQEQLKPKNPSTPQLLVATFRVPHLTKPADAKLGFELADQLRQKLSGIASENDLFVVPLTVINGDLKLAGYKPDSAVSTIELLNLAGVIPAIETIDGTIERLPSGMVEFTGTFYRKNNIAVSESFPPVVGKDPGDVAKKFAPMYQAMRKELAPYQKCKTGLYAQKYDDATAAARATIAAYPTSNIGRLCLASAYYSSKAPPDSIIRVGSEILAHDSTNSIALGFLRDAYIAKGDQAKAAEFAVKIYNLSPGKDNAQSAINALVNSGAPQGALPIIDNMIQADPANKDPYITKLQVQLRLHQYADAYKTADQVVKMDSSYATLDFFKQMIGAAQLDSNTAMALQYSQQAANRFPKDASLQMALYSMLNKAGRQQDALEAAKRAVAADPKVPDGVITVLGLEAALGKVDDAMAFSKAAIAAGADPVTIGPALANAAGPALKTAQASTKAGAPTAVDDWKTALTLALQIDSIAPSVNSKYYIGVAAFSIIQPTGEAIVANQKDKAKACELTKLLKDMTILVNLNMMKGATFDKASAAQILTATPQYEANIPQYEKAFCAPGGY